MPIALRADGDAGRLRAAARQTKEAAQARRLLALAAIYGGASRTEAARSCRRSVLNLRGSAPQPVENTWQFMRDNRLSNRIVRCYDDIVDHCCQAWNRPVEQPWTIMSIGLRDRAHRF